MPTRYEKAPASVVALALDIMTTKERHKALCDCKVKVDYIFAYGERDEKTGNLVANALKLHGVRALAIVKRTSLKDRAKGMGDAEVCIDADHWDEISNNEQAQRAILDHELVHLQVKMGKRGIVRDDLGRPKLVLRDHDYQHGWFNCIALEYGIHSEERQQAKRMMELDGQFYWPALNPSAA